MPERQILVVTGAGASRKLGSREDVPLMVEWAGFLRDKCNDAEPGLAGALRLTDDLSSEDFELVIGELLGLEADLPLINRYQGLGGNPRRPLRAGLVRGEVGTWIGQLERRLGLFEKALRESLYEQFGVRAIDRKKAMDAVGVLMNGLHGDEGVMFATTNYDRSLETGLKANGIAVLDGFSAATDLETPRLTPDGLARWASQDDPSVSVLHLHGAVGWYARADGEIVSQYADQLYNESLGIPAIVPPDPKKDPLNSPYVRAIWFEFTRALSQATHVLVLGHSLHDGPLVEAFREQAPDAKFAISYHDQPQGEVKLGGVMPGVGAGFKKSKINDERGFDRALQFQLDFSPKADMSVLEPWVAG